MMYSLKRASIRPARVVAINNAMVAPMIVKRMTSPGRRACCPTTVAARLSAASIVASHGDGADLSPATELDIALPSTTADVRHPPQRVVPAPAIKVKRRLYASSDGHSL